MILGLNGLIGSGKGAVSEYFQTKYGFQKLSFADSLKEAVSAIFGWEFELLQGITPESREWREIVDVWWANRLNIPNLTPRWVLQQWGTEVGRRCFHEDIWLASLERKLEDTNKDVVIDDCRFKNEMNSIRKYNGKIILINRGTLPEWYDTALRELSYLETYVYETGFESTMRAKYPDVHISEWGWIAEKFDHKIDNNGSLEELYAKLDDLIMNIR